MKYIKTFEKLKFKLDDYVIQISSPDGVVYKILKFDNRENAYQVLELDEDEYNYEIKRFWSQKFLRYATQKEIKNEIIKIDSKKYNI